VAAERAATGRLAAERAATDGLGNEHEPEQLSASA
jgi:hypothetical protein